MTDLDFDEQQWRSLRSWGVTPAQIDELRKVLPACAWLGLRPTSAASMADVGERYKEGLGAIDKLRRLLVAQPVETEGGELARVLLHMEAHALGWQRRDLNAFVEGLQTMAAVLHSLARLRAHEWRDHRSVVVEAVLDALATPGDQASQAIAAKLAPAKGTRGRARDAVRVRRSRFVDVLAVVIEASMGQRVADPSRWIDAWHNDVSMLGKSRRHQFVPRCQSGSESDT